MRYQVRVDRNQPEIVAAFRKMGAAVLITAQLKNAFDLLVGYKGRCYIVEVKDNEKPPSQKKLTPGEQKCKELFEGVGIEYHVIESVEQAIKLLK